MGPRHILIVYPGKIPTPKYGGTSRDIWYLGKELINMGHRITFLVARGSVCDFARVVYFNPDEPLASQIPEDVDLVHSHIPLWEPLPKPYMITLHGNSTDKREFDINTTFISRDHAARFGSEVFVYNGLGLEEYGKPELDKPRSYLHFLGKAAWRVKNLKACMSIARKSGHTLRVLGGYRVNLKMGLRITLDPRIRFEGMVGGEKKNRLINGSKALLFPVRWNEPMGLAVVESLYFGCPVFGTPYGALPELVTPEFGFLSSKESELVKALRHVDAYDRKCCHEYVCDNFASIHMARNFLPLYEKVLNGEALNLVPPRLLDPDPPRFLPWYS
ncbi:MAG: glycosyltransferase [Bacteroidales bacterium]|nr:glycosyltransferase [Bacteroidales bacterium]